MRIRAAVACAFVAALVTAAPSWALDNRIANGEFDTSVNDWSSIVSGTSFWLQSEDADACLGSQSMQVDNSGTTDNFVAEMRTCTTAVTAGDSYQVSGSFRFLEATATSAATLVVYFYTTSDCVGGFIGSPSAAPTASSTVSGWQDRFVGGIVAPVGTGSAWVGVNLQKFNGGDPNADVLVDRVRFTDDTYEFASGFEVGDSCRWSAASP